MIYRFVYLLIFLVGCKSYKNNYEYILGKWAPIKVELIDPHNLIKNTNQKTLDSKIESMKKNIFEYRKDSTLINNVDSEIAPFSFHLSNEIRIQNFKTNDGLIQISFSSHPFKIISPNKFQICISQKSDSALFLITYSRIK